MVLLPLLWICSKGDDTMPRTREEKLEYKRRYNRERAAFLREHKMCAWCGKEKALENKRLCYDCMERSAENHARRYQAMSPEEKAAKNRKSHERAKARRYERREQGLCVQCGRPANGKALCTSCGNRVNAYNREKHRKRGGISYDERGNGTYCFRCCKPVEVVGSMFCTVCYEWQVNQAAHMRKFAKITPSWQADNDRVFQKR